MSQYIRYNGILYRAVDAGADVNKINHRLITLRGELSDLDKKFDLLRAAILNFNKLRYDDADGVVNWCKQQLHNKCWSANSINFFSSVIKNDIKFNVRLHGLFDSGVMKVRTEIHHLIKQELKNYPREYSKIEREIKRLEKEQKQALKQTK